jgi:peptide-methionine (S)-S-oxide reductase
LLDVFWKSHDPTRDSWSRQYRGAIFYHSEEQKSLAVESRDRVAADTKGRIVTAIEPHSGFHIAEDYHQKHSLRLYPDVMNELREAYPDIGTLINSTAAARLNGYLGGYGSCDSLKAEIDGLGLSQKVREIVTSVVCSRKK